MDHFIFHFIGLFTHFLFHFHLFQYYFHPQLQKVNHFDMLNSLTMCYHKFLDKNSMDFQKYLGFKMDWNLNLTIINLSIYQNFHFLMCNYQNFYLF